ncbi:uncharacterized protein LOC116165729 [Photinus pyralis]|uniref:uncharacterized protein LOC116165729 n=1 Tax=Photinus pyralis TaxID=7054 RepID=UPI001266F5CF|nr:uncharacterized protein LOC116165729 [Photinus pyralis]
MPKNATYLSPEIQNDVIEVLAECVRDSIIHDINNADVPWFTLLEDGTKDKNNSENVAIGIRYVREGKVWESIICIKTTEDLDSETFTNLTLNTLQEYGISSDHLLSQCFDGASVMSGKNGGVQARIQKKLNRFIPYVHCSNHRLHLVLIKSIDIPTIKQFFDQCTMLYHFLKQSSVAKLYKGHALSRLLEQRWSGHLHVTSVICNNYKEIVNCLNEAIGKKDFPGDKVAEATGLQRIVTMRPFKFCAVFMNKVLHALEPADKLLQARETDLRQSARITDSLIEVIQGFRDDATFEEIWKICTSGDYNTNTSLAEAEPVENKRRRKVNSALKDCVVMETTGASRDSCNLKSVFFEVLDVMLLELKRRFSENGELIHSLQAAENLEYENIGYLSSVGILFKDY